MKITILLFTVLVCPLASAQSFTLNPNASVTGLNTDFELVAKNRIRNLGSDSLFRWVRVGKTLSAGWETSGCDTNACYFPEVDSAEVIIPPGKTSKLDVYFYPGGSVGQGEVTMKLFLVNNPTQFLTATFTGVAGVTSVLHPESIPILQAYPNPVRDELWVMQKSPDATLMVFNYLGKKVLQQTSSGSIHRLDMKDLDPGIYDVWVQEGDRVIGRTRILKR